MDNRLSGGGLSEFPTYTCNHCHSVVVMNPLRTRERAFCRGCNSYICDACGAVRSQTLECKSMDRVIDQVLNEAERSAPSIILPR